MDLSLPLGQFRLLLVLASQGFLVLVLDMAELVLRVLFQAGAFGLKPGLGGTQVRGIFHGGRRLRALLGGRRRLAGGIGAQAGGQTV